MVGFCMEKAVDTWWIFIWKGGGYMVGFYKKEMEN